MAVVQLDLRPALDDDDEHRLADQLAEFEAHLKRRRFQRYNPYPTQPEAQVERRYHWLRHGYITPHEQLRLAELAAPLYTSGGFKVTQLGDEA